MLLVYYLHFVALLCETLAYGTAVVGRAVVYEYKLIVGISLVQDAFNASLQVASDLIDRDYDT